MPTEVSPEIHPFNPDGIAQATEGPASYILLDAKGNPLFIGSAPRARLQLGRYFTCAARVNGHLPCITHTIEPAVSAAAASERAAALLKQHVETHDGNLPLMNRPRHAMDSGFR